MKRQTVMIRKGQKVQSGRNQNQVAAHDFTATLIPRKYEAPIEYDLHAKKVLDDMGVKFEADFLFHGPYFSEDDQERDVYQIKLSRINSKTNKTPLIIRFGQSIANSDGYKCKFGGPLGLDGQWVAYKGKRPTEYDVLACMEKNFVEPIFEDWASEYGYDTDSIKATETHKACLKQYRDVSRFFTESELEIIREIN